ncbi:hypothetical protein PoB_006410100 [Plakobranchus ocellatus]|uniref:Uncharacterized protein n=1 Tax=Plakobranchus ocellatus TaxID=259542 RepID=A0AAV4D0K8_9GAST|nr:hypothetical protein PoB_006410100 [Plakobranchus ocellatus]
MEQQNQVFFYQHQSLFFGQHQTILLRWTCRECTLVCHKLVKHSAQGESACTRPGKGEITQTELAALAPPAQKDSQTRRQSEAVTLPQRWRDVRVSVIKATPTAVQNYSWCCPVARQVYQHLVRMTCVTIQQAVQLLSHLHPPARPKETTTLHVCSTPLMIPIPPQSLRQIAFSCRLSLPRRASAIVAVRVPTPQWETLSLESLSTPTLVGV